MPRRIWLALIVVAAVASVGAGYFLTRDDEPTFCFADGLLGPDGEMYGRSGDDGCRFVDEDGDVITELNGQPVCYDESLRAVVGPECG